MIRYWVVWIASVGLLAVAAGRVLQGDIEQALLYVILSKLFLMDDLK